MNSVVSKSIVFESEGYRLRGWNDRLRGSILKSRKERYRIRIKEKVFLNICIVSEVMGVTEEKEYHVCQNCQSVYMINN